MSLDDIAFPVEMGASIEFSSRSGVNETSASEAVAVGLVEGLESRS
jgi:hypothetical protein